ncbi:MAG: glycoside hydrolase family 127 protein [Candidatus Lokiarchaeota archaeon]
MNESRKEDLKILEEVPFYQININHDFWNHWIKVNSNTSVFNQLEELQKDGHIQNFQVAAGIKKGIHQGEFYYDSDLYKWLEGACYILKLNENSQKFKTLENKVREIAHLIEKSQLRDGYLNTFYSTKFIQKRFTNLLIFHELYCAGHLFEAALAYKLAFNDEKLLKVAKKLGNLLLTKFLRSKDAPGHPEIELALFKLANQTKISNYKKLAKHFIQMRGNIPHYRTYALQKIIDMQKTLKKSEELSKNHQESKSNTEVAEFFGNLSFLDYVELIKQNFNGKMYQLNKPIKEAYQPVGHAVRAMYFYSGVTDLYMETKDEVYLKALKLIWLKMVKARMYITGGIGSQKAIEGFEGDFLQRLENSYSETCATIGNILWNWRLLRVTRKAKYSDLIEKLLYNAMLVGQSLDGKEYFYYNPLISHGEHERQKWFKCPCCPTNVIRTIPTLGKYIYSTSEKEIWVHQYIGNDINFSLKSNLDISLSMESKFPWKGDINIKLSISQPTLISLFLRIPNWTKSADIKVNSEIIKDQIDPASYFEIKRIWSSKDVVEVHFEMQAKLVHNDRRIKSTKNKVAIKYGPLIYCLEQKDNKDIDIRNIIISKNQNLKINYNKSLLNGIFSISGVTYNGKEFFAIPYYCWGNRGPDNMVVWMKSKK